MGWLKQILEENREAVESWPAWKRRMGMLNDSFEARELQKCWTEIERLAKENTQLKADRDELRKTLGSRYAHAESLMVENGQLKADYLAFVEKHQREINGWAASLQQREQVVETLKTELAQCQADKEEMFRRNKVLRDRPDLPIERLAEYDEIMKHISRSQQREARLRGALREAMVVADPLDRKEYTLGSDLDCIYKTAKRTLEEES